MKKLAFVALLASALGALPAAAQDVGVSDKEVVLGAITPFTGPAGILGYAAVIGSQIAVGEINAEGGVNGRKLRFVAEDDNYVPARTVQSLQKLIDVDKVFAITSASGAAHLLAALPTLEEKGIPSVNPIVASLASYEPVRRTHFGIGMSYRDGAYEMTKKMAAMKPGLKWAVITQDDESGIDQEVGFKKAAAELKLDVVSVQRHRRGQTDFSAEVLRMKEAGANAIFLATLPAMQATVVKEAKKFGMDPVAATLWLSHIPPFIDLIGDAGANVYFYDFAPPFDDPALAGFQKLARTYANPSDLPKMNRYTVIGYVTVKVMAEAMKQCGRELTRRCLIAKLEGIHGYKSGLMAPISFSAQQHLSAMTGRVVTIDPKGRKFVAQN